MYFALFAHSALLSANLTPVSSLIFSLLSLLGHVNIMSSFENELTKDSHWIDITYKKIEGKELDTLLKSLNLK
jgi:hypothetical protein